MTSRQSGQTPGPRAEEIAGRCRALRARVRATGRFDVTLGARLLLRIGEQLRRGAQVPAVARFWRRVVAREHLAAVVEDLAARAAGGALDAIRCEDPDALRLREFLESVRVAVRWACVPRRFEPADLPGWPALSRAVWGFDDALAARGRGGAGEEAGGERGDEGSDEAGGERGDEGGDEAGDEAGDEGGARSAERSPGWAALERYVRRGARRARVEGRAAGDEGFAVVLERLIRRRGGRAGEAARRWAAERRSGGALMRRWAAAPATRHVRDPGPGAVELRVRRAGAAMLAAAPPAACACEGCGAFYAAVDAGGVAVLRAGAAPVELATAAPIAAFATALCHVHPAQPELPPLLFVGTGLGVLQCLAEAPGGAEELWRVHLEGSCARDGAARALRGGGGGAPPSGSALDEITAVAAWGGRAARGVVVATRRRSVFVVRVGRGGASVRGLAPATRGWIRAFVPVAGGFVGLTSAGELVKIPERALRGAGGVELLRSEGGGGGWTALAALDRGLAPSLLVAGPQGVFVHEAEGGNLLRAASMGARAICAASAELGGRRWAILGTGDGEVALWEAERLRGCRGSEAGWLRAEPSAGLALGGGEVARVEALAGRDGGLQVLAALGDGSLHLLDVEAGEAAALPEPRCRVVPFQLDARVPRDDIPESGARWSGPDLDEVWGEGLRGRR